MKKPKSISFLYCVPQKAALLIELPSNEFIRARNLSRDYFFLRSHTSQFDLFCSSSSTYNNFINYFKIYYTKNRLASKHTSRLKASSRHRAQMRFIID
jgi:hypothetical protein